MRRLWHKRTDEGYHKNDSLATIVSNWRGNHHKSGRFSNLHKGHKHGMLSILKWRLGPNPQWREKIFDRWAPQVSPLSSLSKIEGDALLWIGHSSFFMQIDGCRILFDPIFYGLPFVRRRSSLPIEPSAFKGIDYILISHDHYDHLDKSSIRLLVHNNPDVTIICGLNVATLIKKWHKGANVVEMGWYQIFDDGKIKISFLPCQHWGKRWVHDSMSRLWGAFMVEGTKYNIYYSGDTGYGDHFKELPRLFNHIDCAIIGIGAYKPRWFMEPNHISPTDAVRAAKVMGASLTIPMHYGTFSLSDEPMDDPPRVFRREALKNDVKVLVPNIGDIIDLKII